MVYPRVTSRASSFMVVLEITTISQLWDDILSYTYLELGFLYGMVYPTTREGQSGFSPPDGSPQRMPEGGAQR